MTYINPLANALPQSFATQQQLSAEKTPRTRKPPVQAKTTVPETDQFEHQVESPEEMATIHEEAPRKRDDRKQRRQAEKPDSEEGADHIDLTA
jgi:hypothetical protein